jgi:hypothetical protein
MDQATGGRQSIKQGARGPSAYSRKRHEQIRDRRWLLIGAILFAVEIVTAVALLQAVV